MTCTLKQSREIGDLNSVVATRPFFFHSSILTCTTRGLLHLNQSTCLRPMLILHTNRYSNPLYQWTLDVFRIICMALGPRASRWLVKAGFGACCYSIPSIDSQMSFRSELKINPFPLACPSWPVFLPAALMYRISIWPLQDIGQRSVLVSTPMDSHFLFRFHPERPSADILARMSRTP